jgi:hypothetical protein
MSGLKAVRLLALALVTIAFLASLRSTSLSVDGTRYFWLDDDQMISMRYARNLAHGEGLVWNPGERVEGYTNPGWTLVEAGVHLLPLSDAKTSLAVKVITWLLACGVVLLAERLTRQLLPGDTLAPLFVLIVLALCDDLLFWAVNGFDTTLVMFVFLLAIVRLLEERNGTPRPWTYVLLALLPIVRSDAYYIWAGGAAVALGLSKDRRQTTRWLVGSLALPAAHVLWRRSYYGAWLPNTFFVKASIGTARWTSAIAYLKGFVAHYSAALVVVAVGAWRNRTSPAPWLLISGLAGVGYVFLVGADMYTYTRFLAYFIPVLLALTAFSVVTLSRDRLAAGALLVAVGLSILFQIGINGPSRFALLASTNGFPEAGTVVAVAIRDNSAPEASVAVIAAGIVPYFSHRPAIDLMGLTDPHVAHLAPHAGASIGHVKFDPAYSLGRRPDFVVALWAEGYTSNSPDRPTLELQMAADPTFIADYANQKLVIPTPNGPSWVFASRHSPEALRMAGWRLPVVSR